MDSEETPIIGTYYSRRLSVMELEESEKLNEDAGYVPAAFSPLAKAE